MINPNNPNLARPETLFQGFAHFDIATHRFSGKKSFDGQVGGFPLLYDKEKRQLAVDAGDSHTLVIGASGSKKTRSLVMPAVNILAYAGESMIINDPKGELYNRTAGELRNLDYHIITVNLRDPSVGHAWNPLQIPYSYYKAGDIDKAAELANDIAITLALDQISEKDPFWDYSACDCCLGLIMLLFKICKEYDHPDHAVNISNLLRLRRKLFERETNTKNSALWRWASKDELIAASLTGSVMAAQDTMRSILAVLDQKLRAMAIQPSLLDMMANSNFDIAEIGRHKTAVYLITPDEKTTYSSIVAMFISQSYQHLIHSATQNGGRLSVRVNYILDEFSSLPAIGNDFPSMIAAARSRNMRYLICIQSKAQLVRRYKEESATILSNCANWVVLFTRELALLREVSELCGEKRDRTPNISVYDLQHLSKERDEALLLAGKEKPCLVKLLDIDRFGKSSYTVIDFFTPERLPRLNIDFSSLSSPDFSAHLHPDNVTFGVDPISKQIAASYTEADAPSPSTVTAHKKPDDTASEKPINLDALIAKIDKRIAELDEEDGQEAEQQNISEAVRTAAAYAEDREKAPLPGAADPTNT